ncbi:hypothetical protein GUITHDRAFT_99149 [Guillardia theta CCMP2712]|uniref:Uncharacterized protein n=1 Tax=Guillardia theta (strain CCMP2712) TaxID=905079 RepID=L1K471_GUITC|nr:hypothetical protein GUITHDRAFT_99149 [Guillardia theta CCMP2712]EKX55367.1 hypothetical protein GUITHDRAFT_99149 [Guillardia theta CCMP2712]|eukprot:XP_005842347.1 hypothetical protein GUITHDRAFT_99149 [Guillardia theta CCMP2712]
MLECTDHVRFELLGLSNRRQSLMYALEAARLLNRSLVLGEHFDDPFPVMRTPLGFYFNISVMNDYAAITSYEKFFSRMEARPSARTGPEDFKNLEPIAPADLTSRFGDNSEEIVWIDTSFRLVEVGRVRAIFDGNERSRALQARCSSCISRVQPNRQVKFQTLPWSSSHRLAGKMAGLKRNAHKRLKGRAPAQEDEGNTSSTAASFHSQAQEGRGLVRGLFLASDATEEQRELVAEKLPLLDFGDGMRSVTRRLIEEEAPELVATGEEEEQETAGEREDSILNAILEQLVCAKGVVFIGTRRSTFTETIVEERVRNGFLTGSNYLVP